MTGPELPEGLIGKGHAMVRSSLTVLCAVVAIVLAIVFIGFPGIIQSLMLSVGVPGTVRDIFSSDPGFQATCGLTVFALVGFGIPLLLQSLTRTHSLQVLDLLLDPHASPPRRLIDLEAAVAIEPEISHALVPADRWASEQLDSTGSYYLEAHRLPSTLLSSAALFRNLHWAPATRLIPGLLIGIAAVVSLITLSKSADRAFADLMSVTSSDYGTMALGLRSAAAGLAIALCAGLLLWALQRFLDGRLAGFCDRVVNRLDHLVDLERHPLVLAGAPVSPAVTKEFESAVGEIRSFLATLRQDVAVLREQSGAHAETLAGLSALPEAVSRAEMRQHDAIASAQQAIQAVESLKANVTALENIRVQPMAVAANETAVNRLTTAIRSLRETAAARLPRL